MIRGYKGIEPKIGNNVFIAEGVDIIGRITLADNCNIWYQTAMRGDVDEIVVGENTNIQEGSVVHVSAGYPTIIGKNVTIGHKAIVHACKIGDNTLIGMGSIVLDGAEIGEFTLLGAGSLVPPGKKIPSGVLAMGSPAKVIRNLTDEEKQNLIESAKKYVKLANDYK